MNGSDGMEQAQEEQRGDARTHVNQAERKREPDVGMDVAKNTQVEGVLKFKWAYSVALVLISAALSQIKNTSPMYPRA